MNRVDRAASRRDELAVDGAGPSVVDLEQLMDVGTLRDLVRALRKENASWRSRYQAERRERERLEARLVAS
jgi:hypothetical protein